MVNQHTMTTRAKQGLRFPAAYVAAPLSPISMTYRAALADPNWRAAMEEEYNALIANNTWDLVADGTLKRYKARWVVLGFTQHPGIDFDETFSAVVKPATAMLSHPIPPVASSSVQCEERLPTWYSD
jgi:histone deacetylase 1/2